MPEWPNWQPNQMKGHWEKMSDANWRFMSRLAIFFH